MADDAVPPGGAGAPESPPAGGGGADITVGAPGRAVALGHRIRSGEDPVAFGAVVAGLALAAGLVWFWAGARHSAVAAASPSDRPAAQGKGRSAPTAGAEAADGRRNRSSSSSSLAVDPGGGSAPTGEGVAVHVAGAVLRPGLYHLPGGSRVADAIAAAGGRLARADLDRLNLAARLADGQKVFVARRGEPVPPDMGEGGVGGGSGGWADGLGPGGEAADGSAEPVDLNSAGLAALDSLPGVGPATARAILEERTRRGGFRSTRDLLRIPGIGESRFARLKDHVRV